jgi:hypothetical protein
MRTFAAPCDFLVQLDGFHLEELEDEPRFAMNVTWTAETAAVRMDRTERRTPIIEGAAIALAALLFAHLSRRAKCTS